MPAAAKHLTILALVVLESISARAAAPAGESQQPPVAAGSFTPRHFSTSHVGTFNGHTVRYRAVSGDTPLADNQGLTGSIFSFSYLQEGTRDAASRPVTFIYNGGPGSSSIWLHLGVLGPRRIKLDRDVNPSVLPPYVLENNPDCLLDITDLVFIDPIGTGFSRIRGHGKPEDFYSADGDADSVAQFMDAWLTANRRWNSPKYIIGESYGTIRTALVSRMLMGGPLYGGRLHAISINGIALVGATLQPRATQGGDQDYMYLLPNLAATAWYHGKVDHTGTTLEKFVDAAVEFAQTDYLRALLMGSRLTQEERQAVAAKVSAFTGLPAQAVLSASLRVSRQMFAHTLLAANGQDIGMYDSRYTLARSNDVPLDPVADDPGMAQYTPAFNGAWHDYLAGELGVAIDEPYGAIVWKDLYTLWHPERPGVPETQSYATDLVVAMRRNPGLRILVGSGYFDLVTPILSTELAFAQAGVPTDRIRFVRYASGHMIYVGGTATAFAADVRSLYSGRH